MVEVGAVGLSVLEVFAMESLLFTSLVSFLVLRQTAVTITSTRMNTITQLIMIISIVLPD